MSFRIIYCTFFVSSFRTLLLSALVRINVFIIVFITKALIRSDAIAVSVTGELCKNTARLESVTGKK